MGGVVMMLTARRIGGIPLFPLDTASGAHPSVGTAAILGSQATREPLG